METSKCKTFSYKTTKVIQTPSSVILCEHFLHSKSRDTPFNWSLFIVNVSLHANMQRIFKEISRLKIVLVGRIFIRIVSITSTPLLSLSSVREDNNDNTSV